MFPKISHFDRIYRGVSNRESRSSYLLFSADPSTSCLLPCRSLPSNTIGPYTNVLDLYLFPSMPHRHSTILQRQSNKELPLDRIYMEGGRKRLERHRIGGGCKVTNQNTITLTIALTVYCVHNRYRYLNP